MNRPSGNLAMPISPLRRYPAPRYPTRLELSADRELLRRHLPAAWSAIPGTILALLLDAGTQAAEAPPAGGTPAATPAAAGQAVVAPLFKHGEGRGAFGCVVVAPPVFLSEEEAMAVIAEELKTKGVELTQRDQVWADAPIPGRHMQLTIPKGMKREEAWKEEHKHLSLVEDPAKAVPLKVDGVDPVKRIAVEFITEGDYQASGGYDRYESEIIDENDPNSREVSSSTASVTDIVDAANYVAWNVRKFHQDKVFFAAFYDPMESAEMKEPKNVSDKEWLGAWEQARQEAKTAARARSRELLRLQVRDFIAWLEAQGAI
jgi:hypothetical protein